MKTKGTIIGFTLVWAMVLCASAGRSADTKQVRMYPDPGYHLMGGYRGPRSVDYYTMVPQGLGDTFPQKKEWWADRKAEHDAGRLSKHQILSVLYGENRVP